MHFNQEDIHDKSIVVKWTRIFSGVVHQTDCVVHAALGFLLGTGDSSGGGISGGAVLGAQEECLTFS